jgi:hypothetical protein
MGSNDRIDAEFDYKIALNKLSRLGRKTKQIESNPTNYGNYEKY